MMMNNQKSIIKLAEIIGQHPVIYNHSLDDHGKKYIVEKAWGSVVDKINEIYNENVTVLDVKTRWKGIRSSYTRYLAKKHQETALRAYYLSDTLKFLEPFVKPTKFIYPRKDSNAHEDQSESRNEESDEEYDKYFYVNCDGGSTSGDNIIDKKDSDCFDVKHRYDTEFVPYDETVPSTSKKAKLDNGEDNVDLDFFKSILPDIRHLSAKKKRKFKIGILKLIDEVDESRD